MYNKSNKKQQHQDEFLKISKSYLDRDSGITVTESESDIDLHRPNYIFSDDDEEVNHTLLLNNLGDIHNIPTTKATPSYYSNLADQSVISIRKHLLSLEWKKVLKHKSGTTVYMLQNSVEKTAVFRGEAIIQGFTPQSIFYVIGMRKLWDEQFDEGNLIENLTDTTSLTYESYKSTTTSKAYDLTLVEKIECSADGEILFACTSVDTPQVPKTPGKNRNQIKLQGWILKQLNTTPISTKVTFLTQENIKGWIPGLTKKSLARKPLVIASIDSYLRKKADRSRFQQQPQAQQQQQQQQQLQPKININSSSTLSLSSTVNNNSSSTMNISQPSRQSPPSILLQHSNSFSNNLLSPPQQSPTLGNAALENKQQITNSTIILSNPPPRISSLTSRSSSTNSTKHITFADDVGTISRSPSPMSSSDYSSSGSSSARSSYNKEEVAETATQAPPAILSQSTSQTSFSQLSPISEMSPSPFSNNAPKRDFSVSIKSAVAGSKLYPASRHRSARKTCIDQLKAYATSDLSNWKLIGEGNNRTKMYTQTFEGSTLPVMRSDSTLYGAWTPEQICSVVQCFGARKIWDEFFEDGHVVERFSQKEYLIYTQMKTLFPIQSRDFSILTCIESNVSTGTIYVASTSVQDELIPETSQHMRGSFITYGWALEPLKSTQHRLIGVKATFIAHLDMGGVTPLPSAITRLLTTEVPACIDRVQSYLRQNGCPPYIRRVAGKVTLESFDDKEKEYQIEFIAKHAPSARQYRASNSRNSTLIQSMWCTDLRTHTSMYPFGYTIETTQGVRVEMRPDKTGIRIYTEKDDMDGKLVQVMIRQNRDCEPGGKPLFNWNGNLLLSEEDLKAIEKEKEAAVIAAAKAEEDKEEEDEDPIRAAKKAQRKTVIIDPLATGVIEEEVQLVVKRAVNSHMNKKEQQEEPNTKDPIQRRNSHVIIISDELSFTGPQFSFIILLMAICYYFGKFSCHCSY